MFELDKIYGIMNLPVESYSPPTTLFKTSNIKQIEKIINTNGNILIALCITPPINAYKDGLIKEIVIIKSFESFSNQVTTGIGLVNCTSVFEFKEYSKPRDFFNIRPHSQLIIKQISENESNNIIDYMERLKSNNE